MTGIGSIGGPDNPKKTDRPQIPPKMKSLTSDEIGKILAGLREGQNAGAPNNEEDRTGQLKKVFVEEQNKYSKEFEEKAQASEKRLAELKARLMEEHEKREMEKMDNMELERLEAERLEAEEAKNALIEKIRKTIRYE